jgi:hypothetical protein
MANDELISQWSGHQLNFLRLNMVQQRGNMNLNLGARA